ncbi:uncharacterized protein I303_105464 [Kwoniella dejecticola CBS 10117]|uniref:Matrin-type domain-containing protein n=1 Tax=Kwoniella dejecticola CBS 10117 TaxID=1296121 RepID=A0A1A6A2E8_9TREE|nr:uncharacterized protein I303_05094 [Kwoniella dejecticola CBS 10117]OBR84237.1 hypothetical protein I303_05094 [Kwoniella dejecticola CBS 10117]
MTEYWVSKKQYYCKYCSIYIRDDAPSRKQHETGLKHIGNVERYIRDLYKSGSVAKKEKAAEVAEMARIEASAAAAYANDKASGLAPSSSSSRSPLPSTSTPPPAASSSSSSRLKAPGDRFSNYSTAEQLGFHETKTAYEIAQEIKNDIGQPSGWETVEIPALPSGTEEAVVGEKRKYPGGVGADEDEENEGWKFEYDKPSLKRSKDPYEDDWDPSSLKGLKVKKKEEKIYVNPEQVKKEMEEKGLNRQKWTGKLELNAPPANSSTSTGKEGLEYVKGGGWVKKDDVEYDQGAYPESSNDQNGEDRKPDLTQSTSDGNAVGNGGEKVNTPSDPSTGEVKPTLSAAAEESPASASAGSMFKKRRPAPSSRKR